MEPPLRRSTRTAHKRATPDFVDISGKGVCFAHPKGGVIAQEQRERKSASAAVGRIQQKVPKKRSARKDYDVESICGRRETAKGEEFLVCWRGYSERTWVLKHNLGNCTAMLKEFLGHSRTIAELKLTYKSLTGRMPQLPYSNKLKQADIVAWLTEQVEALHTEQAQALDRAGSGSSLCLPEGRALPVAPPSQDCKPNLPRSAPRRSALPKKPVDLCSDSWRPVPLAELNIAMSSVPPGAPSYWAQVAAILQEQRPDSSATSALDCQRSLAARYPSPLRPPVAAPVATGATTTAESSVAVVPKRGTIRWKKFVRTVLDDFDRDYTDDIFADSAVEVAPTGTVEAPPVQQEAAVAQRGGGFTQSLPSSSSEGADSPEFFKALDHTRLDPYIERLRKLQVSKKGNLTSRRAALHANYCKTLAQKAQQA